MLRPFVPNVDGLSTAKAAVAYAEAGLTLVPINPGTKSAGSLLGKGWWQQASCQPELVRLWFAEYRRAGIGLLTGANGLVVFDLDLELPATASLPEELAFLRSTVFQASRTGGPRGHYLFTSDETHSSGDFYLKDGTVAGQVRSGNTIIVVQPTPHSAGGEYRWVRTGVVPPLPNDATSYLRPRAVSANAGGLKEFLAKYRLNPADLTDAQKSRADGKLRGVMSIHSKELCSTGSRHNAMRAAMWVGLSEAVIGYVDARTVLKTLRPLWDKGADEFRALAESVADHVRTLDPEVLQAKSDRCRGDDSRWYADRLPSMRKMN